MTSWCIKQHTEGMHCSICARCSICCTCGKFCMCCGFPDNDASFTRCAVCKFCEVCCDCIEPVFISIQEGKVEKLNEQVKIENYRILVHSIIDNVFHGIIF